MEDTIAEPMETIQTKVVKVETRMLEGSDILSNDSTIGPKKKKSAAKKATPKKKRKSQLKSTLETGRKVGRVTKIVTKIIKKETTITKRSITTKAKKKLNRERKIELKERRFYAWEEDETVIKVLKESGWTYCGEPVKNGREDYPHSMYEAKANGLIDKGAALFWADDDDSRALVGHSSEHLISSIPLAAKALTKSYQQTMFNSFDWFPKCFTLPQELSLLQKYIDEVPESYWICKPDDGYGGNRMCVYRAGSEAFNSTILKRKTTLAVQRYMHNPYLLAGLYKFHFRCYMVITNASNPLRAWLWKNSQIQFATHKFDLTQVEQNFNKYAHITNYKVNNEKKNRKFACANKPGITIGTEWSFQRFVDYMAKECPAFSEDKFWSDLKEIAKVVATKLTTSKHVMKAIKKNNLFQPHHFEIYGLDILLDENLNLAMTEANTQPGLDDTEPMMPNGVHNEEAVRANDITHGIINDTLTLVGCHKKELFSPFIRLV